MVTPQELKAIVRRVPETEGWDFSALNITEETPPWEYEDVVRGYLRPDAVVADIGTGGGEVFQTFAGELGIGYGVDRSTGRLAVADRNRREARVGNLGYVLMEATSLALGNASLDVALAHYADYEAAEVARTLRSGGVFVTQQMGDNNQASIFEAFGWGSYGAYWRERFAAGGRIYKPTAETAKEFESLGCEVVRFDEYDVRQYLIDLESLVFLLKASPLPEEFDPEHHAPAITRLLERHASERGIETNSHRELLIVRR